MQADHAQIRKLAAVLARYPNAGGALVLGLGCKNLTMDQFKEELGAYDPERVKFLIWQEAEDKIAAGAALLKELSGCAGRSQWEDIPAGELVAGMKCGGSDGLSSITANPAAVRCSDRLIALDGSTVLTAAGAHLSLFTAGRGTPFSAPASTVKVSANTALYERKPVWIDFNAGTADQGESLDFAGSRLLGFVLAAAGG